MLRFLGAAFLMTGLIFGSTGLLPERATAADEKKIEEEKKKVLKEKEAAAKKEEQPTRPEPKPMSAEEKKKAEARKQAAAARESREASCLHDVQQTFAQVPARTSDSKYLGAWDDGEIAWPRYTDDLDNFYPGGPGSTLPIGGGQNHFQGIVRYKQYAFVTGSNPHDGSLSYAGQTVSGPDTKGSAFYVIKMNSKSATDAWSNPRGNLQNRKIAKKVLDDVPPTEDKIVHKVRIDRDLWHAGGVQIMEDVLAIPVEDDSRSEVVFYDISNPESPRKLGVKIERSRKAGAVAITRLPNRHILVAVWADSDDDMDQNLDFYYSKTTELSDGFHPYVRWDKDLVRASDRRDQDETFDKFQTVNFVKQCDGSLYLMGLHNTSEMAPTVAGRDYADLYQLLFASDEELTQAVRSGGPTAVLDLLKNPSTYRQVPQITKVANKHMYCHDKQCNFDAGAAPYLADGHTMYIYAVYHWRLDRDRHRNSRVIPFNEYAR